MDNKKNVENEDYQFIREKLVNKKKNRIKKWLLASLGVVALALVFGVVARFAFIKSEHLVQTILGISPTPTQPEITKVPISVAPITPKPTNTPIPTPEPTDEATPTEEVTPSPTPTATLAPEPTGSEGGLLAVYEEIRRLSEESSKYLVSVDFVNLDFDWFGEEIEEITYGGGMVIGDNGVELLILVNAENLTNADRIDVTIAGTRITDVELFMCSTDYGMATIKVELARLNNGELDRITYARFGNSDNLGIGMPLLAIGSPDGHFGAVELAFITSKAQNTYIVDNALEIYNTSLPEVEEGSGVVINMDGEVVGFITHDFKDSKTTSQARFYTINACKDVISRMVNGQNRNYLGVIAKETPANVLSVLGVSNGLYITEVQADSPAALAGLRKGDVITRFGGAELSSTFELNQLLNNYEVGDEVILTYIHGNETQTTSVKIGERT